MTRRVEFPDDKGWVEIRTAWEVTRGERKRILDAIDKMPDGTDKDMLVLQAMIPAWSIGPVTEDAIDNVPVPIANMLIGLLREWIKEVLVPDQGDPSDPKAATGG